LTLLLPSAHATELTWQGFYRGRGLLYDSLSLSDTNELAEGTSNSFDHRLLLAPNWLISEHAAIHAQVDLFKLKLWGQETDTYVDPVTGETIALAQADGVTTEGSGMQAVRGWGEAFTPVGRFAMGRMPMQWGAGVLWNDGMDPEAEYGDTADRFQFTTRIGPVFVLAAWDSQYEGFLGAPDDMEAVSVAAGFRGETTGVGMLNNYRYQPSAAYNAWTGDIWGYAELGGLRLELEAVAVVGGGDLDTGANDITSSAFGLMADARYRTEKWALAGEFGVASGDDDPTDSALKTFTFDRDHNLALFMFEESMPILAAKVPNDTNEGRDTDAVLTTDGIANAVYFRPALRYTIIPNLEAEAAWLTAAQAKDAEADDVTGGYGNEIDLSLRYDPHPHVWVKGTFGVFLPGPYYSEYRDDDLGGGFGATTLGARLVGVVEF
jgi:hypothetical protein